MRGRRRSRGKITSLTRLEIKERENKSSNERERLKRKKQDRNSLVDEYLNQGDRESLEVGSSEDREEEKKDSEFGQERGFFGSSHATPSTKLSLNLFLILILLGLWTV